MRGAGEPSWIRTSDLLIKSQLLYRLSYGPTSARRLPARGAAGKAMGEVAGGEAAADPPAGGDRGERAGARSCAGQLRVRNVQRRERNLPPLHSDDVEVEHARAPAPPAAAAEIALDAL